MPAATAMIRTMMTIAAAVVEIALLPLRCIFSWRRIRWRYLRVQSAAEYASTGESLASPSHTKAARPTQRGGWLPALPPFFPLLHAELFVGFPGFLDRSLVLEGRDVPERSPL